MTIVSRAWSLTLGVALFVAGCDAATDSPPNQADLATDTLMIEEEVALASNDPSTREEKAKPDSSTTDEEATTEEAASGTNAPSTTEENKESDPRIADKEPLTEADLLGTNAPRKEERLADLLKHLAKNGFPLKKHVDEHGRETYTIWETESCRTYTTIRVLDPNGDRYAFERTYGYGYGPVVYALPSAYNWHATMAVFYPQTECTSDSVDPETEERLKRRDFEDADFISAFLQFRPKEMGVPPGNERVRPRSEIDHEADRRYGVEAVAELVQYFQESGFPLEKVSTESDGPQTYAIEKTEDGNCRSQVTFLAFLPHTDDETNERVCSPQHSPVPDAPPMTYNRAGKIAMRGPEVSGKGEAAALARLARHGAGDSEFVKLFRAYKPRQKIDQEDPPNP